MRFEQHNTAKKRPGLSSGKRMPLLLQCYSKDPRVILQFFVLTIDIGAGKSPSAHIQEQMVRAIPASGGSSASSPRGVPAFCSVWVASFPRDAVLNLGSIEDHAMSKRQLHPRFRRIR